MKLSTKGSYGTRAIIDIALYHGKGPVLLKDIAKRQNISEKYLGHIIASLKIAGLVKSIRGAHGGYVLAKPPVEIKLSHIIKALEGSISPIECVDDSALCPRIKVCATRDIWVKIKRTTDKMLESVSLQDLVEEQKKKEKKVKSSSNYNN